MDTSSIDVALVESLKSSNGLLKRAESWRKRERFWPIPRFPSLGRTVADDLGSNHEGGDEEGITFDENLKDG